MPDRAKNIGFVSLGCPKNLVDSERILSRLRAEGYDLIGSYEEADLVIVNTCGFIDSAVEESLEAIGEALQENGKVIVTGCLGKDESRIRSTYPKVLAVTGPHAYEEVVEAVHDQMPAPHDPFTSLLPPEGIKLTPRHYAYLKISEGCNHSCSFCIIPDLRGPLVSRPFAEVMLEAERLVESGVRELLVVSQDTSAYGVDLKYCPDFWQGRPVSSKLKDLAAAMGELQAWVRMHYVYPYPHVDDLIPLMADGHILPYLDMPLQHGNLRVLKQMRRPAATEKVLSRIARWRRSCPELTLRSTFIVGFPGETEAEFEDLLAFLQEAQLDRVGCFAYSPVDGAVANQLPGALPLEVREERQARFMQVQAEISRQRLQAKVGKEMIVLIDEVNQKQVIARSSADAPEIDGRVIIPGGWELEPGDFIKVKITAATAHDLQAEPIEVDETEVD
ncbi:MAG: 30S ribosomal protein S12 methylthiotransferase RimO [Candidatus Thiodiazotropha lotti]|uniref:Ribosomal protein uS12 methylthiotransferase RimO n=1 Tax=Candidatus Thiodiazotropha lotti TaxID=2792787 RepID=A0A9E4K5D6_9GAMM|nr:30S ribosomal protein S12 methylthiotransferase RimO [Candidatus Thiodiazotropha lotti]MCG7939373.1 30S ribosomal protein S12 methylthiotransferase RimO [Candidatus Thiodiazotropha lotti]MCG8005373.1 30S ribosomal protein S12 methylthiotransferase RimO [Candidatus Thiodiazotropha lotti]MCG8008494.1 30S ribosomal protein S12 methylthiotransferase RimO [Candidatus Thiodiazotropha lotti]MCW4189000.1 30S ribosomal protein S12 methylthiotransferase RimO [Candidatus Thiodiazotropha lotti]